mgnify:FL=1
MGEDIVINEDGQTAVALGQDGTGGATILPLPQANVNPTAIFKDNLDKYILNKANEEKAQREYINKLNTGIDTKGIFQKDLGYFNQRTNEYYGNQAKGVADFKKTGNKDYDPYNQQGQGGQKTLLERQLLMNEAGASGKFADQYKQAMEVYNKDPNKWDISNLVEASNLTPLERIKYDKPLIKPKFDLPTDVVSYLKDVDFKPTPNDNITYGNHKGKEFALNTTSTQFNPNQAKELAKTFYTGTMAEDRANEWKKKFESQPEELQIKYITEAEKNGTNPLIDYTADMFKEIKGGEATKKHLQFLPNQSGGSGSQKPKPTYRLGTPTNEVYRTPNVKDKGFLNSTFGKWAYNYKDAKPDNVYAEEQNEIIIDNADPDKKDATIEINDGITQRGKKMAIGNANFLPINYYITKQNEDGTPIFLPKGEEYKYPSLKGKKQLFVNGKFTVKIEAKDLPKYQEQFENVQVVSEDGENLGTSRKSVTSTAKGGKTSLVTITGDVDKPYGSWVEKIGGKELYKLLGDRLSVAKNQGGGATETVTEQVTETPKGATVKEAVKVTEPAKKSNKPNFKKMKKFDLGL